MTLTSDTDRQAKILDVIYSVLLLQHPGNLYEVITTLGKKLETLPIEMQIGNGKH